MGAFISLMYVIVEELADISIQMRLDLDNLKEEKEKEALVLKQIRLYANNGAKAYAFPKGLEWFNVSEELSLVQHLKGKIVLLDYFTYCRLNSKHVLIQLNEIAKEFSVEDGLVVIGVHSAKFKNECSSKSILSVIHKYNIKYPVMNDVTLKMWNNMGIISWPSILMLGPSNQPLAVFINEDEYKSEILLFVKVAIEYFKSLNQISNHSLPLKPVHLSLSSKDNLLFPSKLTVFQLNQKTKIVISDSGNNRIIITNEDGKVEHVIGGFQGFKDGNFKNARFNSPQGICVLNDIIYVADNSNYAIRKIDLTKKIVSTIAGTGLLGRDRTGGRHGTDQVLPCPWDVEIYHHAYENTVVPVLLITTTTGFHQIWALFLKDTIWWKEKKYTAGTCAAIVGTGWEENRNNRSPREAGLAQPSSIVVVQECKVAFFADSGSNSIRRLRLDSGKVSAVCGGSKKLRKFDAYGDVDGKGHSARLHHPLDVTWNHLDKQIYVADTYNHQIKSVDTTTKYCKTLFGNGKPNSTFTFNEPNGLAVSPDGNILYVADTNNHVLKIIDLKNQKISTMVIKRDSDRSTE